MESFVANSDQNLEKTESDVEPKNTEHRLDAAVTSCNLWPLLDEARKTSNTNTDSDCSSNNEKSLNKDMQISKDFMIGSKVKVCDYLDVYYDAVIMEVDYDESEILLHYEDTTQKQDEWISTYSTRLSRSLTKGQTLMHAIKPDPSQMLQAPKRSKTTRKRPNNMYRITKRRKRNNKTGCVLFAPGERCLASWGSNGRFQATVRKVLDFDKYEVIFDDGIVKSYKGTSLKKLKQNRKGKRLSLVKSTAYSGASAAQRGRVVQPDVPIETPPEAPVVFHRHLFDPNLDYLGSKKERREMKRKLNVKDLFSFKKRPIEKISRTTASHKKQPAIKKIKKRPHTFESEESSSRLPPKKKMKRAKAVDRVQNVSSLAPSVSAIIYEPDPIPEIKVLEVKEEPTLAPGEWCCKWLNGQPVGVVSEIEVPSTVVDTGESGANTAPPLARRSVQVDDYRLPPGWSKHMVRRSIGCSAGKWDVVLVCPEGHRFRTKSEMKSYLDETDRRQELSVYEVCLLDFGVHRKRSRQMGWDVTDPTAVGLEGQPAPLPAGNSPIVHSPITKSIKRRVRVPKLVSKKYKKEQRVPLVPLDIPAPELEPLTTPKWENVELTNVPVEALEDGYVYVGSFKVQVIDNLLRCPSEGCLKNFRKDNLLQMHIKHYHRELTSLLGTTPKVADLAYARCQTVRDPIEEPSTPKPQKQPKELKLRIKKESLKMDILSEYDTSQHTLEGWNTSRASNKSDHYSSIDDSPRLTNSLEIDKKHFTQPKQEDDSQNSENKFQVQFSALRETTSSSPRLERILTEKDALFAVSKMEYLSSKSQSPVQNQQPIDSNDIEGAIKVHTVTKAPHSKHRKIKSDRKSDKRKSLGNISFKDIPKKKKRHSTGGSASKPPTGEVWEPYPLSPDETRSSFDNPETQTVSTVATKESKHEESIQPPMFITEGGEKIRIVHMKREEIINCACGYNEEDGLMIQCELCLCWQHAVCHSIETESQVPEKYICYICLNPRRGRRSQRFLHDQSWLYEGVLPTWKGVASVTDPSEASSRASALKKSFELSGNLYLIAQALHAIKIKMHVARKKDHPKLYLWSKPWDPPANRSQHVIVEQVPDLSMMPKLHLNSMMGKENSCPVTLKVEDIKSVMKIDPPDINQMKNPMSSDDGGDTQAVTASSDELSKGTDGQLSGQGSSSNLLVNFLASPGGTSIDLPISTTEFETLAKSVQVECETRACESQPVVPMFPEPEAAIDLVKCREQLHEHVSKALAAFDVRLDSIEAQIAELESQDPSLEDDETAEYCPRTKQAIQMLLRDLETMEELARIT